MTSHAIPAMPAPAPVSLSPIRLKIIEKDGQPSIKIGPPGSEAELLMSAESVHVVIDHNGCRVQFGAEAVVGEIDFPVTEVIRTNPAAIDVDPGRLAEEITAVMLTAGAATTPGEAVVRHLQQVGLVAP